MSNRPAHLSPSQFHRVMASGRGKEMFGKTAQSYAEELVQRMMGVEVDQYVSQAMQDGIDREPFAVGLYEKAKMVFVDGRDPRVRKIHDTHDFISGETDGLVGETGCIEIKSPNEANHFKNLLDGKQINQYKYQIQGYMWLYNREWCDFVSYNPHYPERYQLSINRVVRDDKIISDLNERCVSFWNDIVLPLKQQIDKL